MSTVLVTGAMGQVGKRLTEILLSRGATVVALDLDSEENIAGAAALRPGPGRPGELVPAFVNLVDPDAVRTVVSEHQPRTIVHLAAIVSPPCYRDPEQARRVNVGGTANLVTAGQALTAVQDDAFAAIGLGRIGPSINLPGDPDDDRGWGLTDWFDTTESEELLSFQDHSWSQTLSWVAQSQGRRRTAMRIAGPLVRPALRCLLALQRRQERRGPYADPWALISKTYGSHVLAGSTTAPRENP